MMKKVKNYLSLAVVAALLLLCSIGFAQNKMVETKSVQKGKPVAVTSNKNANAKTNSVKPIMAKPNNVVANAKVAETKTQTPVADDDDEKTWATRIISNELLAVYESFIPGYSERIVKENGINKDFHNYEFIAECIKKYNIEDKFSIDDYKIDLSNRIKAKKIAQEEKRLKEKQLAEKKQASLKPKDENKAEEKKTASPAQVQFILE